METPPLADLAAQLRKPEGEMGLETAHWMNVGNGPMNLHTLAVLNPQAEERILEIGMGNGHFVPNILNLHPRITYVGCDYSTDMVRVSAEKNAEFVQAGRASFVEADIVSLPFKEAEFDKVFSVNTLYFWAEVATTMQTLKRVLKTGGSLLLAIRPKHLMQQMPVTHFGFTLYAKEEVVALFEAHGFSIKGITTLIEPEQQRGEERFTLETLIVEGIKH
jgi:ubiquinone/menaquinone biosynthesis C-methylase UbiE